MCFRVWVLGPTAGHSVTRLGVKSPRLVSATALGRVPAAACSLQWLVHLARRERPLSSLAWPHNSSGRAVQRLPALVWAAWGRQLFARPAMPKRARPAARGGVKKVPKFAPAKRQRSEPKVPETPKRQEPAQLAEQPGKRGRGRPRKARPPALGRHLTAVREYKAALSREERDEWVRSKLPPKRAARCHRATQRARRGAESGPRGATHASGATASACPALAPCLPV